MKENTPPKKEMTAEEESAREEANKLQFERIVKTATDVMKIAERTQCPPEAVALVMLLHGLNAQANFEGAGLRTVLLDLFGRGRIEGVPPGSRLVH